MSTAFVLSGGASLGSIQVGMLEALYERGIRPDLIIGTSAGALNGAFIADRPQTVATARELGEVWRSLRRGQVFPGNPLSSALGLIGAVEPAGEVVARWRREYHAARARLGAGGPLVNPAWEKVMEAAAE